MDDEGQQAGPGAKAGAGQPSEEELRRQVEDQLRRVRVQDLLLESVASLLNLSARRIAKEDERDLEQGKLGIDAVRALVDMLEPEPRAQVERALSEVQVLYAKAAGEGGAAAGGGEAAPSEGAPGSGSAPGGPAKPSPGLWTPPGS